MIWVFLSIAIAGFYGYKMFFDLDKKEFLIGQASHGHFQIELACTSCHTEAFGGDEIIQNACTNCHAEELEAAHDSHPRKKFTDPRNADRIEVLDARYCVSCHVEHQKEQTRPMGVTLPDDYCFHCHQEVVNERVSHKGLDFDSCASAGCHNYHDNRALYEEFLVKNAGGAWVREMKEIFGANAASKIDLSVMTYNKGFHPKLGHDELAEKYPQETQEWSASSHAESEVNCGACHISQADTWIQKPGIEQCENCHSKETKGFMRGKHGMRLAAGLPAMNPAESGLEFKQDASHLTLACDSCHSAHAFDTQDASKQACLGCHNDEHSLAFEQSPHGQLFAQSNLGLLPKESAVTCATCHMSRITAAVGGEHVVSVEHNQNDNLRPNEKMIRPVCMQCHSLEFSIDALADEALIKNNFSGKPVKHIPSIDWAIKRVKKESKKDEIK